MPIWLRKYTHSELKKYYEKKNNETSKPADKQKPKLLRPNITPTYTTKLPPSK